MNEARAHDVLLIRAIEASDPDCTALPAAQRDNATAEALRAVPDGVATPPPARWTDAAERFVSLRAERLVAGLAEGFPGHAGLLRGGHSRGWIAFALPFAALILGLASNGLNGGRQINIVFFPLLGMLAWNLTVYLLLAASALRRPAADRHGRPETHPLRRLVAAFGRPAFALSPRGEVKENAALRAGLARFGRDWLLLGTPLWAARAARHLHVSAAALALGAVAGMYVRGLGLEYLAGWESTFLGEGALSVILAVVLGPASAVSGIPLPDPGQLAAIRWTAGHAGENAAPWIHLYAVTAAMFIVLPRLLLAGAIWLRERRLANAFPLPPPGDAYFRRLLSGAHAGGATVLVAPYSYHLAERNRENLRDLLGDLMGRRTRVTFADPIAYGTEEAYLASAAGLGKAAPEWRFVVFSLAATPEAENHGALMAGLQALGRETRPPQRVVALVDESAYRRRLDGEAGADTRLAQRRAAWQTILGSEALITIDLSQPVSETTRAALDALLAADA